MDFSQLIISLLLDASASWLRMLVALLISIIISLFVGIWAAKSERAGRIILPVVDVLQSLPILAFFPFVIFVVVTYLPPYMGINAAVVFLIITSMVWNIIFGVYESIKTLPTEFTEVASLYKMGGWQRLRKLYIPAAMPNVVQQSVLSWAIGLFYLVTSEIFSTGSSSYTVTHGIGVALTQLALSGNFTDYGIGLLVFVIFVVATRFLLFAPLEKHYSRESKMPGKPMQKKPHPILSHGWGFRLGLFGEIDEMYKKELAKRLSKTIRKAKQTRLEPALTPVLMEMHRQRRDRMYIYGIILLILVAALFVSMGVINFTTLYYEEISLIALAASFVRIWLTFVVVLVVAIPICVYLVFISKKSNRYLTLFQILASLPATIVLPAIVVALQNYPMHAELVAFSVFFLSGIWYVIFSVIASAKALQPDLFEIKKLFHVKGVGAWNNIYLKAIAPGLVTGAVTAIAAMWNASIVAEYFTSTGVGSGTVLSSVGVGMGKLLDTSLSSGNLQLMLIALINLTIMIILINALVWRRLYRRVSEAYK
jgi:NitT/TauT family transport system permease protein